VLDRSFGGTGIYPGELRNLAGNDLRKFRPMVRGSILDQQEIGPLTEGSGRVLLRRKIFIPERLVIASMGDTDLWV